MVCPGKGYPVWQMCSKSFADINKKDPINGPVRQFLIGHSTDSKIRSESASGGIATSLILYLLKSKQIEAAAVVILEDGYPKVKLTADPAIVLAAAGSKYSPVPMMQIIKELQKKPQKIAMTVTPCQLAAFYMATTRLKKIRECLVLAIGLFCGQVKEYESVSHIAASLGVKYPGEAMFLGWRCGAYPGNARFQLTDGSYKDKPLYSWLDISVTHYALKRCFVCPDGGNWLSDITLGDIHAGGNDETVIVCRTAQGEKVLRSAEKESVINLIEMNELQVKSSVIKGIVGSKLIPGIDRIQWLGKKREIVPKYDYPVAEILLKTKKTVILFQRIRYQLTMWLRKSPQHNIFVKHPYLMEKTGHFAYRFPYTIPFFNSAVKIVLKTNGLLHGIIPDLFHKKEKV